MNCSNNKIMLINNLLSNLDSDQKEAVCSPYCDTLCVANAGAGKTRVLTHRVAYLIANGIPENKILLVTFTNKAADEMLQRVKKILNKDNVSVFSGTFHHIAVVFLRKYAKYIDFKNNFTILTPEDSKDLIFVCRQNFLAKHRNIKKDFPSKSIIYQFYTKSINLNKDLSSINKTLYNYSTNIENAIISILEDYEKQKKLNNSMDFDDLLFYFYKLLVDYPEIRNRISDSYPFILVDEYQDINWLQYEIIELLNQKHHHLMVVGDESQSIYSFRGSNVDYIMDFNKNHLNSKRYKIRYNYRSHEDIINLAIGSINNNYHKEPKQIIPFKNKCVKPEVFQAYNDNSQTLYIAKLIKDLNKKGIPYKNMAILIRANFLTKPFEMVLKKEGIPYKIVSGISFFERQHVRDMLSFLKFYHNRNDKVAFYRMIELFDGIGRKTTIKLFNYITQTNSNIVYIETENLPFKLNKRANKSVQKFNEIFNKMYKQNNIDDKLKIVWSSFYNNYMKNKYDDCFSREQDIKMLIKSASMYNDINMFLSDTVLDNQKDEENIKEEDSVIISTVHKAKGLEWECVFVPYMNECFFPSRKSVEIQDIEEERRLFYVAITRAMKYLYIGYVTNSFLLKEQAKPSMFLTELSNSLFDYNNIQ